MIKILFLLFQLASSAWAIDPNCTTTTHLGIYRCPSGSRDWYLSYTGVLDNTEGQWKTHIGSHTFIGRSTDTYVVNVASANLTSILFRVSHAGGTEIRGITDANTAAAGFVGQIISTNAVADRDPTISNVYYPISTTTLTAGNWSCTAACRLSVGGSMAATEVLCVLSTTQAGEDSTRLGGIASYSGVPSVSSRLILATDPRLYNVSTDTTLYLNARVIFTALGGGTWDSNSNIRCERIR